MTERIESITGYPLDDFQKCALEVIVKGDDLLVTCPTGSGKTTVALTGIVLEAFDKGHRAILITPIKALGNQMYSNFQTFLTKIGFPNRVTLLTGDIQNRCCSLGGDGSPELLLMTSEILANKLDKSNRADSSLDQDLENVSLLVVDETHYINDPERGNVWERIFVYLPKTIQIIALSATLSNPEKFCEWLSKRRPTQLVQRFDRHVPLHTGGYDTTGNFIELYSTKNPQKSFESSVFKKLVTNGTILKLVGLLIKRDQLPAIVFCLSKQRCIDSAGSIKDNLLYGKLTTLDPEIDPDTAAYLEEERQHTVKTIRAQQEDIFQKFLGPYRKLLDTLPGWHEFKALLDRGIAYHHSGMIPMFREYVEILFKEKLIKIVFATESLAVGIDMPARTVVFTQLEKPTGKDGGMSLLTPDQFWQIAGRSGRRGKDTKGYVIYYPVRFNHTEGELRQLMFGKMPSATSHLSINPVFVLKNLSSTSTILQKTLLFHEIEQHKQAIEQKLAELPTSPQVEAVRSYLYKKTQKLSQSQRKALDKERSLFSERDLELVQTRDRLEKDLERYTEQLTDDWQTSLDFLVQNGFITNTPELTLTIRGRVTSGLSDGEPLVRGRMIADGCLQDATFEEIIGWLGCFTDPIRPNVVLDTHDYTLLMNTTFETYGREPAIAELPYDTGVLLYLWASHKDLREICTYIDMTQLGVFIRSVMRVMSYLEELKPVLLGLEMYEVYNRLDNYQDRLLDGIVTNRSLYVS